MMNAKEEAEMGGCHHAKHRDQTVILGNSLEVCQPCALLFARLVDMRNRYERDGPW